MAIIIYSTACLRQRTFPNIDQTHLAIPLKATLRTSGPTQYFN